MTEYVDFCGEKGNLVDFVKYRTINKLTCSLGVRFNEWGSKEVTEFHPIKRKNFIKCHTTTSEKNAVAHDVS